MHIIYRTCTAVGSKPRPAWFSKEACLKNALEVFGGHCPQVGGPSWTLIVDKPTEAFKKFVNDLLYVVPMQYINEGHNSRAFLKALDYACTLEGTIYLVEDDYLHLPGSPQLLEEGLRLFDYVTLYDHPDKYGSQYDYLESFVKCGRLSHWRTVPSTTMTFAVKAETLRADRDIWTAYCQGVYPYDHRAFRELGYGSSGNRTVGSCIPGRATHCEEKWLSPLVDWSKV